MPLIEALNDKIMHSTLNKWLEELDEEAVVIASNEIEEEALGNMVTFGFSDDLLEEWGKGSVSEFLTACATLYKKKK